MNLSYRWVIVAAGALMTCVALGAMFSLAIFLEPMSLDTGWSRAGISSAMTLNFLVMGVGGFAWGAIYDRLGARPVVLAGAVLLGLALVVASRAGSLLVFQLSYGVIVGLAASAFFAPMIALTTAWFDTNRSLAVSLVSAGMGVAPMTISPFARWLISAYDWRTAMFDIGVMAWVLLLPAVLLVRQPPAAVAHDGSMPAPAADDPGMSVGQALRSPEFIVLALTFFACCAAHSGPIFHMVSYAMACGVAPMAAVSIYSVEGLAGLGGRVLYGVLADRLGVKPVLIAGLAVQGVVIAAYLGAARLEHFYVLAVIFGATYGGVMPLYAVLAREYFGGRIIGTVLGAATMLSSLGMSFGPLAGGMIYDAYASYSWLFIGSALVGLGAAGIAIAFPPQPSRQRLQMA
ncbi:MAG: MFS transporter [Mesorhizobium sp.]|uniref:MFS transporter n=1 Tax=Mesorhizobium sp. TaxID=1871066 RepID=UPI000FE86D78|nr:MFS transporter [Mesorhizobium sp.]RWM02335.1 MAG: MFS transporter [Mesorhizobium sp.]TIO50320.1 MAG: MFS transporter [Mesorhizobium sp.]TIO59015.1 MAG: MFS transporter [Mesorhizobium sp.]TJV61991.1 MAG: MFS transporter [Mesorhizobium sp.]